MRLFVLSFLLFCSSHLFAQKKNVESAKVAFISQRTDLTPAQAEKFWPVYNEYHHQKAELRRSIRTAFHDMTDKKDLTADGIKHRLSQINQLKQKELNLEKEYQDRCLLVITPQQLVSLIDAEHEFHRMLLKKMGDE